MADSITNESLKLANNLIEMIKAAREKGSPLRVSEIVDQLPAQVSNLVNNYAAEVSVLRAALADYRDMTIAEARSNVSFLRYKKYRLLRDFKTRIFAIEAQLDALSFDVLAIAHCKDAEELLGVALGKARPKNERIDNDTGLEMKIGELLDLAEAHADELREELDKILNPLRESEE